VVDVERDDELAEILSEGGLVGVHEKIDRFLVVFQLLRGSP
jgi:hypothetical protein